jgi:acetyl esterase/lipase
MFHLLGILLILSLLLLIAIRMLHSAMRNKLIMLVTSLIPNALLRKAFRVLRGFTVRSFFRDTRFSLVRWGNFDVIDFRQPCECQPSNDGVLYLHGGGFVLHDNCDLNVMDRLLPELAELLKGKSTPKVFSLQYTLAPNFSYRPVYEEVLEQVLTAYHRLKQSNVNIKAVMGDSAGGNLALWLVFRLQEQGVAPPALCLISPWVDIFSENRLRPAVTGDYISTTWLNQCRNDYLGTDFQSTHPILSAPVLTGHELSQLTSNPLALALRPGLVASNALLAALPRTRVFAGGNELFLEDIKGFVRRAQVAGATDVSITVGQNDVHNYPAFHKHPLRAPLQSLNLELLFWLLCPFRGTKGIKNGDICDSVQAREAITEMVNFLIKV